jgi:hypothetical protein
MLPISTVQSCEIFAISLAFKNLGLDKDTQALLRIGIRDQVPFWPLDPRWVKNQDPDPGWTIRIMFIPDPVSGIFSIQDPGVKNAPDPVSGTLIQYIWIHDIDTNINNVGLAN